MNPLLRNVLAVVAGFLVGSIINISLVRLGHNVLPIEGIDPNDMGALASIMPELDAKYFIFPFLAHALGTLFGAAIAAFIAINHKMKLAMGVGLVFLIGGIVASTMITAPTWFVTSDLILAYIPMAWIGGKIATLKKGSVK